MQCIVEVHNQSDMHLHAEIESLHQRLLERDNHIVTMETHFLNEADKFPNGELASIKEEVLTWQEKYSRLHEAHKRVQKVNQNLEDKLLRIVDKCETEKGAFTKDIATLSHRLADANYTIHRLTQDNENYRNDVNLAIQLLQCKPSNFVGQKYDSLPAEVQAKVRTYVAQKRRTSDTTIPDVKSITVPISTFPPTAMVYNVTKANIDKDSDDECDTAKPPIDMVSAAIMAKVLEDREKERIFAKHCNTCTCHKSILLIDTGIQTMDTENLYSCSDCETKGAQNTSETASSINKMQVNDNFSSYDRSVLKNENIEYFTMSHTIQEMDDKTFNNGNVKRHNDNTKHTTFKHVNEKSYTRSNQGNENPRIDYFIGDGTKAYLNLKNSIRQQSMLNMADNTISLQSENQNETFGNQISSTNEKAIGRTIIENTRQIRGSKRMDSQSIIKSGQNSWYKFEKKSPHTNCTSARKSDGDSTQKVQSQIDVINDRLWKNEWAKSKVHLHSSDGSSEHKSRTSGDTGIDVINDRVWKHDKSRINDTGSTPLTVIEVTNAENLVNQSDCRQPEDAASPSFSNDSLVISTSDPSSSSSDAVQPINKKHSLYNNSTSLKVTWQERATGPRNCLVRVTPGSKNILLDNVGQYQTVLYTTGNGRPSTALVHTAKSSRSGRTASTSSEENAPILPQDSAQLQRVAEWVQSSGCSEKSLLLNERSAQKPADNTSKRRQNVSSASIERTKSGSKKSDVEASERERRVTSAKRSHVSENKAVSTRDTYMPNLCDIKVSPDSQNVSEQSTEGDKDLITFESSNDDETTSHPKVSKEPASASDLNYEVKVTREMEETYLKLAASLDPVSLRLPSSTSADLTIEKYRKDHKRLHGQKIQDKLSPTT
ncbi:uncharacterized protein LOC105698154 isoform X2 [Orussus abietinus]|nr:uncharacterized protein LOC105698154 isoform X2 [Orussus abietinus]